MKTTKEGKPMITAVWRDPYYHATLSNGMAIESVDGDCWTIGHSDTPATGEEFEATRILLVGGERAGEIVA